MRIYYQSVFTPACELFSGGQASVTPSPPNLAYELLEARALADRGNIVEIGTPGGPVRRPDVVIASTELVARPALRLAQAGIPFLCRWMSCIDPESTDPVYLGCIAAAWRADAHYASCAFIADQVSGVIGHPVEVIPHPIYLPEEQDVVSAVRDLDVLFVGWLSDTKCVDLLIDACEEAGKALGIVGVGPALPALLEQGKASKEPVTFFGALFDAALYAVYLRAERYVSASISDSWAVPIGEALAHGCDVAHRDNVGIRAAWEGAVAWWTTRDELVALLKKPILGAPHLRRQFILDKGYNALSVGTKLDALVRRTVAAYARS